LSAGTRRAKSALMSVATAVAAGLVVLPLLLIFGFLLYQGAAALNLDFFTHLPKPGAWRTRSWAA
jgi:phosphate transport system permease protein